VIGSVFVSFLHNYLEFSKRTCGSIGQHRQIRVRDFPQQGVLSNQQSAGGKIQTLNDMIICVYIFNFNSILDRFSTAVTGWCVPQNVFCWGRDKPTTRISAENSFSIRMTIFPIFVVRRSDFDSRFQRNQAFYSSQLFNGIWFLFLQSKILRSFRPSIFSTNSSNHTLSRECGIHTFNSFLLVLWQIQNEEDLFGISKIDRVKKLYPIFEKCTMIQRIRSRGISFRDFSKFERTKKFYYGHSAKKCIKYLLDSRDHLKNKTVCCSWPPIASKCGSFWL